MNNIKIYKNYRPLSIPDASSNETTHVNGVSHDLYNYAVAPNHFALKSKLDTNHYLPPPPREQIADPVNGYMKDTPYKRRGRYELSTQEGIEGIVQNQINNANYVRGNQFSLSEAVKRLEYTAEYPVQNVGNKEIVISNSPFYPYPNYKLTFDKDYRTYPAPRRYVNGKPIIETFNHKNFSIGPITVIIIIFIAIFLHK